MLHTSTASSTHIARSLARREMEPPVPEAPTRALPGTHDKVAILEERARAGQGLWHPSDWKWADAPPDTTTRRRVSRLTGGLITFHAEPNEPENDLKLEDVIDFRKLRSGAFGVE